MAMAPDDKCMNGMDWCLAKSVYYTTHSSGIRERDLLQLGIMLHISFG